jgi:hypothetical protein
MVPIFLNAKGGREGYSFDEFGRKFETICHTHHKEGRALAFAFILYDFEHAEIAKVLHDEDYWNALNKISGKYLTVFSFHLAKQYRGVARPASRVGRSSSGSFSDSKQFISELFGAELPSAKPVILFFQVTGDEISDPCVVEVRAETVEKAFLEIRSILSDAVESVERVLPEFRGNTAEVFNLIVTRLQQRKAALFIKKAVGVAGSVQDLAGRLKGF